jgi:hypothetical protein
MFFQSSDGYKESLILSKIPVTMAKNTTCTCGSNMKLTNHFLNKKGNILEFSGEYICEKCEKSKNTFIQKIGRSLISFWAKTKKISIGTTGVTYEKEGSG